MDDLQQAIDLARALHAEQTDLGGHPYIEHVLWVMEHVNGSNAKVCAVLHDSIEDTEITANDLLEQGFSKKVVRSVKWITKHSLEPRIFYILRIAFGPRIALNVKIADLAHNIDISRIPEPEPWHYKRIKMYKFERAFLVIVRLLRIGF